MELLEFLFMGLDSDDDFGIFNFDDVKDFANKDV